MPTGSIHALNPKPFERNSSIIIIVEACIAVLNISPMPILSALNLTISIMTMQLTVIKRINFATNKKCDCNKKTNYIFYVFHFLLFYNYLTSLKDQYPEP